MRFPSLNRQLAVETRALAPDAAGGFTETWIASGTIWAAIRPSRGRVTAGETHASGRVNWTILVRGAPDGDPARPVPGQRLRDGARTWRIRTVAEHDPGGRFLSLTAEEETVL